VAVLRSDIQREVVWRFGGTQAGWGRVSSVSVSVSVELYDRRRRTGSTELDEGLHDLYGRTVPSGLVQRCVTGRGAFAHVNPGEFGEESRCVGVPTEHEIVLCASSDGKKGIPVTYVRCVQPSFFFG
jgi:hypothetical protein